MSYGSSSNEMDAVNNSLRVSVAAAKTKNNIRGWYFYSFSSEPFAVSAVATYIPLLLEQFARTNGVSIYDHSIRCTTSHDKCVLGLFNNRVFIDTSSFALYTFSASVFFQTILVITVSGLADIWKSVIFKSRVLITFGFLGSLSLICISQLNINQYYSLAVLCIIANTCYGVVNVVGNSLLPSLVSDLIKYDNTQTNKDVDSMTSIISGCGASIGYASALFVQIVTMWLIKHSKSQDDIQIGALFVGVWWVVWQMPISWLLKDVNTSSLIEESSSRHDEPIFKLEYMKYGWLSIFEALKRARLLKDVVIFLLSWFIISDSLTTINSTAILFSKTELKMSTLNLIVVSILTVISAIIGAYFIPHFVAQRLNWSPKDTLLYIICWASVIPFYGMLGFVFKNFGLKHQFEMYIMAVWYGLSLGGLAAVSRSLFSLIIPKGRESTFFSLFSITDKGSSIVGPVLIGFLTDRTHNIRYSFYLLFGLLILSLPILNSLDVARGKIEAQQLANIEVDGEENNGWSA